MTARGKDRAGRSEPDRASGQGRDNREKRFVLTPASKIRPENPRWAWEGRIPLKAVSLLIGPPGLGKSTVQAMLAAQLTRGEAPGEFHGKPVKVVMVSAEDSAASTIRPRLEAAGADLARVLLLTVEIDDATGMMALPSDVKRLRNALRRVRARVLFIDPLVAYLDEGVDSYKDQHVRRVIAMLTQMAEELGVAINAVMHLNKKETQDILARISGAGGFGAAARSVLAVGRDPNDPDRARGGMRVIAHVKCNVGPQLPSLAAHIEPVALPHAGEDVLTSRLVLDGESPVEGAELLLAAISSDERLAREEAADFLREQLANGREVRASELLSRAKDELDVSANTLRRAKKEVGVRTREVRGNTGSYWVWFIPPPDVANAAEPKKRRKRGR